MRLACCLVAACLLIWASSSHAQPRAAGASDRRVQPASSESDAIRLDVLDCPQVSGASVRELVALEVAPRQVLGVGSTAAAATHAALACPAGVAKISVDDARLATPLQLEIALHDLDPPARSRLVALAMAELITTSRLQRAERAGPVASRAGSAAAGSDGRVAGSGAAVAAGSDGRVAGSGAAGAAAASDVRAAGSSSGKAGAAAGSDGRVASDVGGAPGDGSVAAASGAEAAPALQLGDASAAAASDAALGAEDAPAAGGGDALGMQLWLGVGAARMAEPIMFAPAAAGGVSVYWRVFALNADLRFEHAQTTRSVAELQLDAGSVALVPAWRVHTRMADVSIGPGLRAGYASMRATPREAALLGQTLNGFWLAPCAQLALQVRFAESWAVRAGAELAYITRTLRGLDPNGASVLALRDLALAAQLGISWDAVAAR